MAKENLTSPVGRMVMGSLYKANTTDHEGKPLIVKSGPNAGQPTVKYFFALAIPKLPTDNGHWANTEWGAKIWAAGNAAFPNIAQNPAFAWKIEDGDSQVPNRKGRKPCDSEGFAGNWVVKFSSSFAPKVYMLDGSNNAVQVLQEDYVKPGYYAQVAFSFEGNGSAATPGMYINPSMVCFRGYGPEITTGPDVASAGFGAAPLPAGVSHTPPAIPTGVSMPVATPPAAVTPPAVPTGIPVIPNHSLANNAAGIAPPPAMPSAPVTPPAHQMTATATATYEQYIAAGWNDAQLVQHGFMVG